MERARVANLRRFQYFKDHVRSTRALFDSVESDTIAEEFYPEDIDEPEDSSNSKITKNKGEPKSTSNQSDIRYKIKLYNQIQDFLTKLKDERFAETATATQLIQASAFPLAIISYGIRGGWVEKESAQSWSMQTLDTLFHQSYKNNLQGLLNYVYKRYCDTETGDQFTQIVGEGTLWLALLYSIASTPWTGQNASFRKAFALRLLSRSENLVASTNSGQMASLITRVEEAKIRAVFMLAPVAVILLSDLENILNRDRETLFSLQDNSQNICDVGDLLWMPANNWAECMETSSLQSNFLAYLHLRATTKKVSGKLFLNISKISNQRNDIAQLLAKIDKLDTSAV
jgi:hypothetical protein